MTGKSILILEDDADIRESIKQILELEGYQVFSAANGKAGLQELARIPRPCVILLDLMMPVMNGWDFLDEFRKDEKLASIPVIVISAAGERVRNVVAAEFITKPFELTELLDTLARYCGA